MTNPLILFPGARLDNSCRIVADPAAKVVVGESFLAHDPKGAGRPFNHLTSRLELATPEGAVLVRNHQALSGADFAAGRPGITGAWRAQATLFVFRRERNPRPLIDALRRAIDQRNVYAGASALPNGAGAWTRILAADGAALTSAMTAAWVAAREVLAGIAPRRN